MKIFNRITNNSDKKKMTIIILSAAPKSTATKSIINAGVKRGHNMIVLDPKYLYLVVSDAESGYDRVFDGYDQRNKPVRIKAKDIDAVISRIGKNLAYGTSVLHHFRYNLGIFTTQSPEGIKIASDKLLSLQKISSAKIKVPKTVIADNSVHIDWLVNQIGGLPAIAKTLRGSQGVGVIILESERQTNTTLETFYKQKTKLLLQQFIDSNATDIRAIVIDNKVVVAMKRTSNTNDFRANISLGGSGEKIILSDADKEMCIKASNACGLTVSGVDLLKDANGTSYIIEVNTNYGYHVESITGVDISTPLIKYCEENYKGGNKNNTTNKYDNVETNKRIPIQQMFSEIAEWGNDSDFSNYLDEIDTLFAKVTYIAVRSNFDENLKYADVKLVSEFENLKRKLVVQKSANNL